MNFLQILILGLIQGAAELLPVSSSAHVIVVEKLMGLDPSSPEMTFLLIMLHTGTMFAVIVYFLELVEGQLFFQQLCSSASTTMNVVVAHSRHGYYVGFGLKMVIEKVFLHGAEKAEVESLLQPPLDREERPYGGWTSDYFFRTAGGKKRVPGSVRSAYSKLS